MKKLYIILLIISLIVVGGLYLQNDKFYEVTNEKALFENIDFGYMPFSTNWAVYVAKKEGLFEKYGINANLVKFNSGTDGANALLQGDVQAFAINTFTDILNIEKRSPGQLKLYTLQESTDSMHSEFLITKNGVGVESISDLEDKKIGVTLGTLTTAMVKQAYGDMLNFNTSVTIVPLAPNLHLQSLESGHIDALLAYEPTATLAQQNNIGSILDDHPWKRVAEPFPIGGVTFSSQFISEHSVTAKRVANALRDAITIGREDPKKIYEAVSEYTGLDAEIASQMGYNRDSFAEEINPKSLIKAAELYAKLGVIDDIVDTSNMLYVPEN